MNTEKHPDWAYEVLFELEVNMDIFVSFENSHPKDSDIIQAIYNLQYWNAAGYVKWYEFCDRNRLERPPFAANEISKYDGSQIELEFK